MVKSQSTRFKCFGSILLWVGIASLLGLAAFASHAQESPNYADALPRLPPTEASKTLPDFVIQPGYRLELVASEPLVRDPVAMSFDELGRLFVVEMCDYSEQDKDFLGTIKLLTDSDRDGIFDKATPYVEKLSWPTGVLCFDGGVFVAAAPDIWYFKDADGDGVAEIRTKVFTGFGRTNVQGLLNSFCWGLDNRIYCQISSSGAQISRPDKPEVAAINANGRDFSFDPRTLEFRLESGGGQHGMAFDDWGRRYTCSNSDHLQLFLYQDRYSASNSIFPLPPSRRSIAVDGPQANVHRISPVEPWRIIRTRLRVTNQTPGMIEGGGRAAGYFTSATGVTIYRGNQFPQDMYGTAIVGDVGSNIIHRKQLTDEGISQLGERIDLNSELVASRDIWFRPVQFANAPDGSLYIADLYREVIEHPLSLPPEIKQHLDLTSGRDRGRIYRLVADGTKPPADSTTAFLATSSDSALSDSALIESLEHPNGWHRDTASRLLYERLSRMPSPSALTADTSDADRALSHESRRAIVSGLQKIALHGKTPQGRLHALGLLQREESAEETLVASLSDENPHVREWALQWCEPFLATNELAQKKLTELAHDNHARVRFQLALSLSASQFPPADKASLAYQILKTSGDDPYIRAACFNSIGSQAVLILEQELSKPLATDQIQQLLPIAQIAGRLSDPELLASIDRTLAQGTRQAKDFSGIEVQILDALQMRLPKPADLKAFLDQLPHLNQLRTSLIGGSRASLADDSLATNKRIDALKYLMWDPQEEDVPTLVSLFKKQDDAPLQSAASAALRRLTFNTVPSELLANWPALTPRLRSSVIEIVFSRAAWTDVLLDVAERGNFNLVDLDVVRLNALRNGPRTKVRANKLVVDSTAGSRSEIYEDYRRSLAMPGDRERGKLVFAKACSACHKVDGVGYEIGPNLVSFQFRGAEAILQNIIEPNREVNPQYVSYTIATHDDRILTGMITNESASSVTLMRGENQIDTVDRSEISEMKSSRLSLMPEGLEQQIDHQSMADLLNYLTTLQ